MQSGKNIKIKVCGMRDIQNITELITLKPDFIGFIFYPPSKRFVKGILNSCEIIIIPDTIIKTGVFVNEDTGIILRTVDEFKLQAVQLSGNETPEICNELKNKGIRILKTFHMDNSFDFNIIEPYLKNVDYVLFDTKSDGYGGSGIKFNWSILESYKYEIPFFLSGGITEDDIPEINDIKNPAFFGVDINSRFELSPAVKDIEKIKKFMKNLIK